MAENTDNQNSSPEENISALENILEMFPDDTYSLEALVLAYEEKQETEKAREKALQLAQAYLDQSNLDEASRVANHLLEINADDEKAKELLQKIGQHSAQEEEAAEEGKENQGEAGVDEEEENREGEVAEATFDFQQTANTQKEEENAGQEDTEAQKEEENAGQEDTEAQKEAEDATSTELLHDLSGELDLAWFLLQNELLTQEQYEEAVANLTESRLSPNSEAVQSFLHELEAMDRVDVNWILAVLANESGVPYIQIEQFGLRAEAVGLIPLAQVKKLGVLPFERLGEEVMVAVLNPLDKELKTLISNYLNQKIHVFFTSPSGFSQAVEKAEQLLGKS